MQNAFLFKNNSSNRSLTNQLLLLIDCKMNRPNLLRLMELIIESRQRRNDLALSTEMGGEWMGQLIGSFDWDQKVRCPSEEWLQRARTELGRVCKCANSNSNRAYQRSFCDSCSEFIRLFEISRAIKVCDKFT